MVIYSDIRAIGKRIIHLVDDLIYEASFYMTTIINYSSAHKPLEQDLEADFASAVRIDISVAFVTKYGFDFIEECLNQHPLEPELRFVASVRYPTNLDRMAAFANRYPGKIWIHLGGLTPEEIGGDRYQLHSKAFRIENTQGQVAIYIGSHNLTAAALRGINIEAGARILCSRSSPPACDILKHIDHAIGESELFDHQRLDFYKAAQQILQGWPAPSQLLEDFQHDDRLVILAEAADPILLNSPELQLFFSPLGPQAAYALRLRRKVSLYLYPSNTLFPASSGRSYSYPMHFDGEITMVNNNIDAAVTSRPINSLIEDMRYPIVRPAMTIPSARIGDFQVVALLKNQGQAEIPTYHSSSGKPKIKSQLEYSNRENVLNQLYVGQHVRDYFTKKSISGNRFVTQSPFAIESRISLNIPNREKREIYRADPLRRLEQIDARMIHERGQRRIYDSQTRSSREEWETEYFYQVSYSRKWSPSD